MIEIKNLCKSYDNKMIYQELNLSIQDRTINCIVGPSGCGKTTLLRLLAGLEDYNAGEILGTTGIKKAFVFQEDRLMPWLSVKENIEYVLASYCTKDQMGKQVAKMLQLLKLTGQEDVPVYKLSGGMKRRVAIGRALAFDSELLLLDEPFKGLDDDLKWHVLKGMLAYLEEKPRTVICVTHDREVAMKLGHIIDIEKLNNV